MEDLLFRIDLFECKIEMLYQHVVDNRHIKSDLFLAFPSAVCNAHKLHRGISIPSDEIYQYVENKLTLRGQHSFSRSFMTALEFSDMNLDSNSKRVIMTVNDVQALSLELACLHLDSECRELLDCIVEHDNKGFDREFSDYLLDRFTRIHPENLEVIESYVANEEEFILECGRLHVNILSETDEQLQLSASIA